MEDHFNGAEWRIVEECNHRHVWDFHDDTGLIINQENNNIDVVHAPSSTSFELFVELPDLELVTYRRNDALAGVVTDQNIFSSPQFNDDCFIADDLEDDTIDEYEEEDGENTSLDDDGGDGVGGGDNDDDHDDDGGGGGGGDD